jgi:4a-hydroxytetrahydrobiopterin dehydratase
MATLLDAHLLDETLRALPGWQGDPHEIYREVHVDSGTVAELVRQVELAAAGMDHPPRVEQVPGGCRFVLTTPRQGGVTELDIALASRISDVAHRLDPSEPGVHAVRQDEVEIKDAPDAIGT